MAEALSETGQTVQDAVSGALDASLKYIKLPEGGAEIAIHISTTNIRVAKELCKLAAYVVVGTGVTTLGGLLGYKVLKPLVESAVKKAFGGDRNDQDTDEIKPGSLHVIIRCFTDERFMEVVDDYECGRINERLQREFSQVGIEVEGLKVEIENIEEVNKTRKEINKIRSAFLTKETETSSEESVEIPKVSPAKIMRKMDKVKVVLGRWNEAQRHRLAAEKNVLDHYFPGKVKWIDPTGDTKVDVTLNTNNDNMYTLRIYIEDFPNSVPDMVVVSSPKPMPTSEDWDGSFSNHTLSRRDGYLRICYYHESQWTDRSSLYEVVMKGRVWLEAYEGHLRTGQPMSYFLREIEGSDGSLQSLWERWSFMPSRTSGTRSNDGRCVCL